MEGICIYDELLWEILTSICNTYSILTTKAENQWSSIWVKPVPKTETRTQFVALENADSFPYGG